MIYIVSVHIDDKWRELQAEQFAKFTRGRHVVTTGSPVPFNGSAANNHCSNIHALMPIVFDHIELMVVCDSDAFPIAEWDGRIKQLCKKFDFVAIQRIEHHRYRKRLPPHPSFVAWNPKKSDVSFYMEETFGGPTVAGWQERNWRGLHRSIASFSDASSIRCGVYGDMIYHHGFVSRLDDGFNEKMHRKIEKAFWKDPVKFVETCR